MINPFGNPPLLASAAGPGAPRGFPGAGPLVKRQCGSQPERRAVALRKPITGEALIDSDGVVWLVESVRDKGDNGCYLTSVARITRTAGGDDDSDALHDLSRDEFATFCNTKGIILRGGD